MLQYVIIYLKIRRTYQDVLNSLKVSKSMLQFIISFRNISCTLLVSYERLQNLCHFFFIFINF